MSQIYSYKIALEKIHQENIRMIEEISNSNKSYMLFDTTGNLHEWVYEFSCPYQQYEEHGDNVDEVIRIAGVHNQLLRDAIQNGTPIE